MKKFYRLLVLGFFVTCFSYGAAVFGGQINPAPVLVRIEPEIFRECRNGDTLHLFLTRHLLDVALSDSASNLILGLLDEHGIHLPIRPGIPEVKKVIAYMDRVVSKEQRDSLIRRTEFHPAKYELRDKDGRRPRLDAWTRWTWGNDLPLLGYQTVKVKDAKVVYQTETRRRMYYNKTYEFQSVACLDSYLNGFNDSSLCISPHNPQTLFAPDHCRMIGLVLGGEPGMQNILPIEVGEGPKSGFFVSEKFGITASQVKIKLIKDITMSPESGFDEKISLNIKEAADSFDGWSIGVLFNSARRGYLKASMLFATSGDVSHKRLLVPGAGEYRTAYVREITVIQGDFRGYGAINLIDERYINLAFLMGLGINGGGYKIKTNMKDYLPFDSHRYGGFIVSAGSIFNLGPLALHAFWDFRLPGDNFAQQLQFGGALQWDFWGIG